MTKSKDDLIRYRLSRSKDTFDDAKILVSYIHNYSLGDKKAITMICTISIKTW